MEKIKLNALQLMKSCEYEKAANLYLQIASLRPNDENNYIMAANCFDLLTNKEMALSLYIKAYEVNPESVDVLLNLATISYELKKYEQAKDYATKTLEIEEFNFSAMMNLGNIAYAQADFLNAIEYYKQLYYLNPTSYNAIINIANTFYNLEHFNKAIKFALLAIEKRPKSIDGYIVAGNSYSELEQFDKAHSYLKKSYDINPDLEIVNSSIATFFTKTGNLKNSLFYSWKVLSTPEKEFDIGEHINFGYLIYEAYTENEEDLVVKYLELWNENFADSSITKYVTAAILGKQQFIKSDEIYVKNLFDGFADTFDEVLYNLDYKVPHLIAEFTKDIVKSKMFKKSRILDLGCGTGLCAQELLPYFPNEEYIGVDMSDKMLEIAREKNIYAELYAYDIADYLEENDIPNSLVVFGDVLTYIGGLKKMFNNLIKNVEFNGYCCFSITLNKVNDNDYFLMPSGRFVHTLAYVKRILKHCGFEVIREEKHVLRKEGNSDVDGMIILARKNIEVVFE